MSRIDVTIPGDNSEVKIEPLSGDQVVMSFNSGPNVGTGYISIGSSGGVSLVGVLYADKELTKSLTPREGSIGMASANFAIGMDWSVGPVKYPRVEINTDLWFAVEVAAAGNEGKKLGTSANLHLPQPQRDHPPHRRHDRTGRG